VNDRTMDLIRDANPYPGTLPPLPIEPVMRRLAEDPPPEPAARVRRTPRPNIGGVMVAVSVVVALGIAVAAIAAFSHSHRTTLAGSSPVASSRQQLLRTLGVLRRPQTKADLLATRPGGDGGELPGILRIASAGVCRRENTSLLPCTLRLDTPLVRAVTVGDRYRAAIFPTKIERSTPQARRGEGVVIALRGPGLYIITSSPTPTLAQALRTRGLLLSDYAASGVDRGVMLVPDGVARLTLDHFRLLAPHVAGLGQIPPVAATVTDNFALLQISGLTEQNLHLNPQALGRYFTQGSGNGCRTTFAVYSLPATAQMTWFGPGRAPIRRRTINLRLDVGTHHPAVGTIPSGPGARAACQAALIRRRDAAGSRSSRRP
jgi:hypothetical protein